MILATRFIEDIDFKEATSIAEGLRHNAVLTSNMHIILALDLSYNKIGDLGAIAIGSSLAVNNGLWELSIS
jgi:hypothetical protein